MLAKYGLSDAYGKPTPCTKSIYEQRLLDPVTPYPSLEKDDFSRQIGTLGYLRHTRPDLCVGLSNSPKKVDMDPDTSGQYATSCDTARQACFEAYTSNPTSN